MHRLNINFIHSTRAQNGHRPIFTHRRARVCVCESVCVRIELSTRVRVLNIRSIYRERIRIPVVFQYSHAKQYLWNIYSIIRLPERVGSLYRILLQKQYSMQLWPQQKRHHSVSLLCRRTRPLSALATVKYTPLVNSRRCR